MTDTPRPLDPAQEDELFDRLGYRDYALLLRLRLRNQRRPTRAKDWITHVDRTDAVHAALTRLEEHHGLLTRHTHMDTERGRTTTYRTHVPNDPLQHTE